MFGLTAYKKGSISPYKVLYKWKDVEKHNSNKNAVEIPKDLWAFLQLLSRNKQLLTDIQDFQKKYGCAKTNKEKLQAAINPQRNVLFVKTKYHLVAHGFKRHITSLGKDMGGKHLFLLFYAGVLDTNPINLSAWFHSPFTILYDYQNSRISINIHSGDISHNLLTNFINDNWKKIEKHLPNLPKKEKYTASERDLLIVDSKKRGVTDLDVMDKVTETFPDQEDIYPQTVKVARLRTKKKIDNLYKDRKFKTKKSTKKSMKHKKK